jgi:bifunctional DNA-binding transcriptional regulator/antitoxin component of YhaV-PrlF toxin-antitoxin module
MTTIKLTTKRQATFPSRLCEDMGIGPGDELIIENRIIDGQLVWVMRSPQDRLSWMGALNKYARGKSHDLKDIRRSIGRAVKK